MANGKSKGSSFERKNCKTLSLWWSDGVNDAMFWRTSNSGGRATVRNKKQLDTYGQYGDIQATTSSSKVLIELCVIEIKKGYGRSNFGDIIDAPQKAAKQQYVKFIEQVLADQAKAKTPFWMLITARDRRETLISFPTRFLGALLEKGVSFTEATPYCRTTIALDSGDKDRIHVFTVRFSDFLTHVKPQVIRKIWKEYYGRKSIRRKRKRN